MEKKNQENKGKKKVKMTCGMVEESGGKLTPLLINSWDDKREEKRKEKRKRKIKIKKKKKEWEWSKQGSSVDKKEKKGREKEKGNE